MAETALKRGRKPKARLSQPVATRETAFDLSSLWGIIEDPDEVIKKNGGNDYDVYPKIEYDGHLTAVMGSRLSAVKSLDWDIIRGEASEPVYDEVKKVITPKIVNKFIEYQHNALKWGMAVVEVIWAMDGAQWVPVDVELRPKRWFGFDDDGQLVFYRGGYLKGEIPDPYHLILMTHEANYENPYGIKLLAKSYWPVTFKRNSMKWSQVFLEKYAMPWVIGGVPPGADATEVDRLLDELEKMVKDSIISWPNDSELKFEYPGSKGGADIYEKTEKFMDTELSKIWLGQTLTTEVGDVGAYAASKTHQGVKDEWRDGDATRTEAGLNQLISWFIELNYGGEAPTIKFSVPFSYSKELAERDAILATSCGVKFKKQHFETEHGLNREWFEVVEKEQGSPFPGKDDDEGFSQFARGKDFPDQLAVDSALRRMPDKELNEQAAELLKPLFDLVDGFESFDGLWEAVAALYPKLDVDEDFVQRLVFASETWGRMSANAEADNA